MNVKTIAAAHTPEARAKAAATRKRNLRLKKKMGTELPLSAIPPRPAPKPARDPLLRDLARVLIQLTDLILKGR